MLQMSEARLQAYTAEDISGLLDKVRPILDYRTELYKRYTRKNGPFEVIGADRSKKVVPFEYYITNMVKGYVGGKAPQYNVRKGDGQADTYVK